MNDIFEFREGDYICYYKLVQDPDSPFPDDKIFEFIGKELIQR